MKFRSNNAKDYFNQVQLLIFKKISSMNALASVLPNKKEKMVIFFLLQGFSIPENCSLINLPRYHKLVHVQNKI